MTLIPEIDTFACVAHGDCAVVAPQAFRVDDVAVVVGTAPDDVLLGAARACPAGAIVLFDDETGEEVDPG
jgi:ferredoxin